MIPTIQTLSLFVSLSIPVLAEVSSTGFTKVVTAPRSGYKGGPSRFKSAAAPSTQEHKHTRTHARDLPRAAAAGRAASIDIATKAKRQATSVEEDAVAAQGYFYESLTLGDQPLLIDFDTGSPELWVMTSSTTGLAYNRNGNAMQTTVGALAMANSSLPAPYNLQADKAHYIPTVNSAYGPDVSYGIGEMQGSWAGTTVSLGALSFQQTFAVASSVTPDFMLAYQTQGVNGLLGLAPPQDNVAASAQTFVGNMAQHAGQAVFTVDLREDGGHYTFGKIDSGDYTGQIQYVNLLARNQPYWGFAASSVAFAVGNAPFATYTSQELMIVDTGTTYTYLRESDVQAYYRGINTGTASQDDLITMPCETQPPALQMAFAGTSQTIKVPLQSNPYGMGMCIGPIQVSSQNVLILGESFHQGSFVVYDASPNANGAYSVGFAAKA